jgi:ferredoxin-like protein FixX
VDASYIRDDLYRTRNMRLAFKDGFLVGAAKAGRMTVTGGRFPGGRIAMHADADAPRTAGEETAIVPDGVLTIGKLDAVFKSGNATRDTIPSHLLVGRDVSGEVADFYAHVCPAGCARTGRDELRVNPPNCIDCEATDVLARAGPRAEAAVPATGSCNEMPTRRRELLAFGGNAPPAAEDTGPPPTRCWWTRGERRVPLDRSAWSSCRSSRSSRSTTSSSRPT